MSSLRTLKNFLYRKKSSDKTLNRDNERNWRDETLIQLHNEELTPQELYEKVGPGVTEEVFRSWLNTAEQIGLIKLKRPTVRSKDIYCLNNSTKQIAEELKRD